MHYLDWCIKDSHPWVMSLDEAENHLNQCTFLLTCGSSPSPYSVSSGDHAFGPACHRFHAAGENFTKWHQPLVLHLKCSLERPTWTATNMEWWTNASAIYCELYTYNYRLYNHEFRYDFWYVGFFRLFTFFLDMTCQARGDQLLGQKWRVPAGIPVVVNVRRGWPTWGCKRVEWMLQDGLGDTEWYWHIPFYMLIFPEIRDL